MLAATLSTQGSPKNAKCNQIFRERTAGFLLFSLLLMQDGPKKKKNNIVSLLGDPHFQLVEWCVSFAEPSLKSLQGTFRTRQKKVTDLNPETE